MTWPFENDTSIVEKKLASRSMKADRRRSIFIILTIALAVCLMGTLSFIYSAQQKQTLDNILGQYQAGCSGLTREEVMRLAEAGRFEKWGYTADAGSVRHEDSTLNVSFVSEEMIGLMGYGEMVGNYPQEENELCIDRSFLKFFDLPAEVGQTLTLNLGSGEKAYTVTGILESENDSRIFTVWISEDSVDTAGHKAPYDLRFRFAGSEAMKAEQLRMDIEAKSGMHGELKRDYGLLIFIFIFSLINLANTLITNLLARQQEFGVFQSVGMSGRQMSSMLSYECLYYIGITLFVTLTVGTVCSLAVCHIFDQVGMFGKLTYHFPAIQVLLFAAALLLVQAVFSVCAVRYTRKLSLVERIKATE